MAGKANEIGGAKIVWDGISEAVCIFSADREVHAVDSIAREDGGQDIMAGTGGVVGIKLEICVGGGLTPGLIVVVPAATEEAGE